MGHTSKRVGGSAGLWTRGQHVQRPCGRMEARVLEEQRKAREAVRSEAGEAGRCQSRHDLGVTCWLRLGRKGKQRENNNGIQTEGRK